MKTSVLRANLLALLFAVFSYFSFAQQQAALPGTQLAQPQQLERCGSDQIHQHMMATDPVYAQKMADYEAYVESINSGAQKVSPSQYTVPVVVHVMETGNSLTAITDAQIREGIKQLNERYRKVPGSLGDGNGVDVELEFALAVRDPSGNCTNGIVRYDMTGNATYMADGVYRQSAGISDASLKALSVWDQTQYYNIWLVSEIDGNDGGAGIQGYAYFATSHGTSVDGAVILVSNWKDGTSTTGAHEIGHAFNLYHTFEGDNGGVSCPSVSNGCGSGVGDCCGDTPPHIRAPYDCVIGTNACDGGSSEALHKHNYMDYSSDACQNEFTADQKTRVIAAMTGIRTSFLASNGNVSLVPPTTAGVAFEASNSFVCMGDLVYFTDLSSCIPNTYLDTTGWTGITFNWTFTNGGNIYTSTLQNPVMNFPVAGSYDVVLQVTDAFGTTSHTEAGFVVVGVSPTAACTPGSNNEGNYWNTVNNVSFNTINNATSQYYNVAYTDFSCSANTVVTEGTTHQMDIDLRAGGSGTEVVEVYIDYNNNGSFLDAGELVLSGSTGGTSTTATVSGNVTIPTNAVENTLLRMRVIGEAGSLTNNERSCASNLFIGDVEDYGVYIMTACTPPVISVSGTTDPTGCLTSDGTITISGTGLGDMAWTGPMSGTATGVSLPYTITGLTNGTYSIVYGTSTCSSNTVNATLNVAGAPADPTITASGATTFCDGGSVVLTSSYGTNNVWSTGETTQSITVSTSGSYTVTYTDGGGCSATSAPTLVVVNALPSAPTVSPAGPVAICSGGSVVLTSSQASGNTWSTTETTQSITVSSAGTYTVTYTDGNSCTSPASTGVVVTVATGGAALPISEGFTSATFPPTNWSINNGGNTSVTWQRDGAVGNAPTAGNSAYMDNYNTDITGDQDDLVVEAFDLSAYTSAQMTFDVAYARYDATYFDQLDVLVTTDCGQNYTTVYSKSGSTLATDADVTSAYSPGTWRNETIDLTAYAGEARVEVLFRNISGYGNFLYLDNINITGAGACAQPDVPTLTASPTTLCDGATTTLTITGNLNDATDWQVYTTSCGGTNVGSTTGNSIVLTPSAPGTTYYVRGEGGCVTPGSCGSVAVIVNSTEDATFAYSAATYCAADADPTPTITGVGGGTFTVAPAGLSLNSSTGQVDLSASTPGVYTVTYTTPGACTGTSSVSFEVVANPSAPVVSVADNCGSSTLTATGTSLLWSTTETTSSITVTVAGTYTVTDTQNGCTSAPGSGVANPLASPTIATGTVTDPSTCGNNDGSIVVTGSGTGVVTWSGTASGTSGTVTLPYTISGLTDGSYTITFDDGCPSNTLSVTLSDPGTPATPVVTVVDNCGSSTLSATGTNLLWSTGETTASITVTAAGTYTVTDTQTGCTSAPGSGTAAPLSIPSAITLTSPADASTGVAVPTSFTWTASSDPSATYTIEIASDAAFTTIVDQATGLATNSYTSSALSGGVMYYWRVTVSNTCGSSAASSVFTFTTSNCTIYASSDVPVAIPTPGTGTYTSTLTVATTGTINDLNVLDMIGTHAAVGNLTFTLISPLGTNVTLMAAQCGNQNDFDIDFDDEAASAVIPCPPTDGNAYQPAGLLSAFDGEDPNGVWTLSIQDNVNPNGGQLTGWSLEICTNPPVACTDPDVPTLSIAPGTYCEGDLVTISISGNLNDATDWTVYTGSCGGTLEGVTATNTFNTNAVAGNNDFFIRGEGGCVTPGSCATVSINAGAPTTGFETVTACDSYTWSANSTTYTTSGTYTALLTNAAGCDSTATLILTINNSTTGSETISACDSYTWSANSTTYTTSGTYTATLTNAAGCDSIATLNLTINNSTTGSETISACDSYTWSANSTTYTTSGTYTATLTNAAGCDSIATLNLTINNSTTGSETIAACDSYTWSANSTTYTTSGTYTATLTNAAGCDSIATLNLTINNSTTGSETIVACDSYTWPANSTTYTTSGAYTALLTNSVGCDSIAVLNLTINNSTAGSETIAACNSYTWSANSTTYTTSGTYTATLTNAAGCDSTATLNLTISTFTTGTDVITACDSYIWIDGNTYTASNNTATHTIVGGSVSGCDSVVTLNLTINYSTFGTETMTACDSYTWSANSTTYTASGTYTATLTNAAGCDSTATLNLTINSSTSSSETIVACDSYTWSANSTTYTTSGTYTALLTNSAGCDSVAVLNLTINNSTTGSETIAACDSYTWSANSTTYTTSGTYTALLTNSAGCDSVAVLNLTINNSTTGTETVTACDSYTWSANSTTYTTSGTYTALLTNAAGCDSIATLNLTINNSTSGTETVTSCDSYVWSANGMAYNASGTYTATLTNVAGCDSVVTLNLTITTYSTGTDVITACDSYTWIDGNTYTASNNTATHTIVGGTVNGCDSIVTLNLTVNYATSGSESITACDSYTWSANSTTYTTGGTYTALLTNAAGCDSTATLNLTINNSTTGSETIVACDSYTWSANSTMYTASGTYTATLTNAAGCDSLVTLNLTINNSTTGSETVTACDSYTWSANGTTYTTSGAYTTLLTNSVGCDSVAVLNLTINNSTFGSETVAACDSYVWSANGTTYTAGGTYTALLTNAAGCDSVATLNLTINNSTTGSETVTACDNYTWSANSTTYTTSGAYTALLTNAAGCDSVVTLNLTINTSTSSSETVSACDSYTWSANGTTYTTSGTYTALLTNTAGCDSVLTLDLTINYATTGTDVITACDSYTWIDGITYTASNNAATWTLTNAAGCDSVVTLDLTIETIDNSAFQVSYNTLQANLNGATYQWIDCSNNAPVSGATNQSFTATANGSYAVIVSAGACTDTSDCLTIDQIGIDEVGMHDITVYPNPTHNVVTVVADGAVIESVSVYDASGRLVSEIATKSDEVQIDLSDYATGVYQLKIMTQGTHTWKRVLKK